MDVSLTDASSTAGLARSTAVVSGAPQPARERPVAGTRAWFIFFVVWMAGWTGLALFAFKGSAGGDEFALRIWLAALLCFYLSLCNSFVPLPTAWIILLAASSDFALVQTGWLRVVSVAGLATLATVVANLTEYHLLSYLLHFGLGRRVRRTKVYGWSVRWFDRAPFQLLTLIALVPVPIDAVRWLAVLRGYSRPRFAAAYAVGRGGRYLLFAWCAVLLKLGALEILIIQVGLIGVALGARLIWHLVQRARRRMQNARARECAPGTEEITLETAVSAMPDNETQP